MRYLLRTPQEMTFIHKLFAPLRSWWLTAATIAGSISLLTWAAWIVAIDPAAPPSTIRPHIAQADLLAEVAVAQVDKPARQREPQRLAPQVQKDAHETRQSDEPHAVGPGGPQVRGSAPSTPVRESAQETEQREPQGLAPQVHGSAPLVQDHALEEHSAAPGDDSTPPDRDAGDKPARRTLAGWVFDDGGTGVSGIRVVADGRRMFEGGQSPPMGLRARSDGSGAFAFASVPDGEYQLRTEATTDYDSASALVRAGADSVVLNVKPKSGKTLLVHGVVESSRGKALDAVRVELVGRPALSAFSDAEGRYSLRIEASGRLQNPAVRFTRKGYRDFVAPLAAAPAPGPADVVQNARLEEIGDSSTLAGSVHGTDGGAVNGATIELYSAALSRSYRASTDHNGTFTIRNVEQAIDYRLWVRPTAKYRDRTLDNVIIGGSIDVVVDAIAAATVTGHFVTPDNQPVPAFTMWLTPAFGANRAMAVTSDSSGAFTVTNVPEGPFVLGTRAAPMLSVTGLEASSKPSGDLRIPLDVGTSRLEGTLAGDDGRPVGGARLSLHWSSGIGMSSTSSRETVTDANGYFLFTQLGAGNHALAVTATGYRALQSAVAVGPVNAPITLTLQRGH